MYRSHWKKTEGKIHFTAGSRMLSQLFKSLLEHPSKRWACAHDEVWKWNWALNGEEDYSILRSPKIIRRTFKMTTSCEQILIWAFKRFSWTDLVVPERATSRINAGNQENRWKNIVVWIYINLVFYYEIENILEKDTRQWGPWDCKY